MIKPIQTRNIVPALALLGCATASNAALIGVHSGTGNLYNISTTDASSAYLSSTGIAGLGSLEYSNDGKLYGFTTGSSSTLYEIDAATGNAKSIGSLGGTFVYEGGLAIDSNGMAYGTNRGNETIPTLFSIDLQTGLATNIGIMSGGFHDINGLTLRNDGMLVGLDRVTNSLLEINPFTAASSIITTLSPTVGAVGGMVSNGVTGYFSTSGLGGTKPGSHELYAFDLFTGETQLIGGLAPTLDDMGISGLAINPVPLPAALPLFMFGLGALGLFYRKRRQS